MENVPGPGNILESNGADVRQRRSDAKALLEAKNIFVELGYTQAEIAILGRQGFVSSECRGKGTVIYKLRFRSDGRQQVRYLGVDPIKAENISRALELLQRKRVLKHRIQNACRDARKALREGKHQLAPQLESAGYKFHGLAIRRARRVTTGTAQ